MGVRRTCSFSADALAADAQPVAGRPNAIGARLVRNHSFVEAQDRAARYRQQGISLVAIVMPVVPTGAAPC